MKTVARRERRPQLAAWPLAGDGAGGRHDHDPGRGADGRDPRPQALTSMTSGRGDYSMHFLRYEEVPTHVGQKIIEQTKREREKSEGLEGRPGTPVPGTHVRLCLHLRLGLALVAVAQVVQDVRDVGEAAARGHAGRTPAARSARDGSGTGREKNIRGRYRPSHGNDGGACSPPRTFREIDRSAPAVSARQGLDPLVEQPFARA